MGADPSIAQNQSGAKLREALTKRWADQHRQDQVMDEQEILAVLRAHVARSQSNGANGDESDRAPAPPARVDFSELDHLNAELWRLRNSVGQLNPRGAGVVNRAVQAFKKLVRRSLTWHTRSLHDYHDGVNQAMEYHARALASLQRQVLQLGGGLPEVLQETLRTARRATQEQMAPYAPLFRELAPVLDLGCGRGEFLELLKREGVSAYGVDSDHLACQDAQRNALKVVEADLFEHLAQLPDRSLGGIFAARVVEYLPPHRQVEMVSLCASKLKPGGLLVLETVNPDSEFPFGRTSHIDPSHIRALYPEVLKAMLESNGFAGCTLSVLAPQQVCVAASSNGAEPPAESRGTTAGLASVPLSRAPAYAAVARRP